MMTASVGTPARRTTAATNSTSGSAVSMNHAKASINVDTSSGAPDVVVRGDVDGSHSLTIQDAVCIAKAYKLTGLDVELSSFE
jgi:hypothetical protein